MGVPYFPGCTLSTTARDLDTAGRACAAALGFELAELPGWNCCGAAFPLTGENLMALVGPARALFGAAHHGDQLVTLCAACFNVLKRTQYYLDGHPAEQARIAAFVEDDYPARLRVRHLLEVLRDDLGWAALAKRVEKPLAGLRAAPYYGCLLLRPARELGLDDPEEPAILEDLLRALGAEPVDFPYKTECCGSYLRVGQPDLAGRLSGRVAASARKAGADVIVTACPVCQSNVGEVGTLPVVYFTQLMAQALDVKCKT